MLAAHGAEAAVAALRRATLAQETAEAAARQVESLQDELRRGLAATRTGLADLHGALTVVRAEVTGLREELVWSFAERRVAAARAVQQRDRSGAAAVDLTPRVIDLRDRRDVGAGEWTAV